MLQLQPLFINIIQLECFGLHCNHMLSWLISNVIINLISYFDVIIASFLTYNCQSIFNIINFIECNRTNLYPSISLFRTEDLLKKRLWPELYLNQIFLFWPADVIYLHISLFCPKKKARCWYLCSDQVMIYTYSDQKMLPTCWYPCFDQKILSKCWYPCFLLEDAILRLRNWF